MWTLRILLMISWIASGLVCTAQVHCIPISESILLHEDAVKLRSQIALTDSLEGAIVILQTEKAKTFESLNQIIVIEKEKTQLQSGQSEHYKHLSTAYQDENKRLKKEVRKARWQRNGAVLIGVVLIVLFSL